MRPARRVSVLAIRVRGLHYPVRVAGSLLRLARPPSWGIRATVLCVLGLTEVGYRSGYVFAGSVSIPTVQFASRSFCPDKLPIDSGACLHPPRWQARAAPPFLYSY